MTIDYYIMVEHWGQLILARAHFPGGYYLLFYIDIAHRCFDPRGGYYQDIR